MQIFSVIKALAADIGAFPVIILIAVAFSIFSAFKKNAAQQKQAAAKAQQGKSEDVFDVSPQTSAPKPAAQPKTQSYNDIFEEFKKRMDTAKPADTSVAKEASSKSSIDDTKSYGEIYREQLKTAPVETDLEKHRKAAESKRAKDNAPRKAIEATLVEHSHPAAAQDNNYYIEEAAEGTNSLGITEFTEGCIEHGSERLVSVDEIMETEDHPLTPLQQYIVFGEVFGTPAYKK